MAEDQDSVKPRGDDEPISLAPVSFEDALRAVSKIPPPDDKETESSQDEDND